MLSLLQKLKSILGYLPIIIAIAAIIFGFYEKREVAKLTQQYASCNASNELLSSAVDTWKKDAAAYAHSIKLKDAQVAKSNEASNKTVQAILHRQYSSDCNTAIKQGLQELHN